MASPQIVKKPSASASVDEIRATLEALGIEPKGKKETLLKRLKRAWAGLSGSTTTPSTPTEEDLESSKKARDFHDTPRGRWKAFLVLDVEGTCESGKDFSFPNEIIEFPVVLVKWVSQASAENGMELVVVDSFQSYVKPVWRSRLSTFATSLTGITQATVNDSPTFVEMLPAFREFLTKHDLWHEEEEERDFLWVTDGPFDLRDFVAKQCFISGVPHPHYLAGPVLDLKQAVASFLTEEWKADQAQRPVNIPLPASPSPEVLGGWDEPESTTPDPKPNTSWNLDATEASPSTWTQAPEETEVCSTSVRPSPNSPCELGPPLASTSQSSTPTLTPSTSTTKPLPPNIDTDFLPPELLAGKPSVSRNKKKRKKVKVQQPNFYLNISDILQRLDIGPFQGRTHSGIDDAKNIARILIEIERRGVLLEPNRIIRPGDKKWSWQGEDGKVIWGREPET